ncbi:hypothetical protein LCGC14_2418470 [marine sediment metagenome]|uniref:Uncharacterized protein n=1 Tax=marine sediment metagenome TaxID=412755 RepID=A0A0F9BQG2_9ZZZZ
MITQGGPQCDVCGDYILVGNCNPFRMEGFDGTLMCHDKCKDFVLTAMRTNDYKGLPQGPLREAYETYDSKPI